MSLRPNGGDVLAAEEALSAREARAAARAAALEVVEKVASPRGKGKAKENAADVVSVHSDVHSDSDAASSSEHEVSKHRNVSQDSIRLARMEAVLQQVQEEGKQREAQLLWRVHELEQAARAPKPQREVNEGASSSTTSSQPVPRREHMEVARAPLVKSDEARARIVAEVVRRMKEPVKAIDQEVERAVEEVLRVVNPEKAKPKHGPQCACKGRLEQPGRGMNRKAAIAKYGMCRGHFADGERDTRYPARCTCGYCGHHKAQGLRDDDDQ